MKAADTQPELARIHLLIGGRVQGVGFRFAAWDEAAALGLRGWVRNLGGGEVEIVAEGRKDSLRVLAAWANQGPRAARVSRVHEEWEAYRAEFNDFRVR
jgi:acylphosphatase